MFYNNDNVFIFDYGNLNTKFPELLNSHSFVDVGETKDEFYLSSVKSIISRIETQELPELPEVPEVPLKSQHIKGKVYQITKDKLAELDFNDGDKISSVNLITIILDRGDDFEFNVDAYCYVLEKHNIIEESGLKSKL
jgi:hypothetical protein